MNIFTLVYRQEYVEKITTTVRTEFPKPDLDIGARPFPLPDEHQEEEEEEEWDDPMEEDEMTTVTDEATTEVTTVTDEVMTEATTEGSTEGVETSTTKSNVRTDEEFDDLSTTVTVYRR